MFVLNLNPFKLILFEDCFVLKSTLELENLMVLYEKNKESIVKYHKKIKIWNEKIIEKNQKS
ncbi:hypothetical protein BpHYR1_026493 [Brachionus plicatilis]|uniref:Uncharacterized protein n=1 Tax=Brachionus plicatilis TaxID=10195 RepID=A0A3M7QH17_BRAPC|nr:hypothetical protein BpHYR1_026493 [Brachionus plicatilis]